MATPILSMDATNAGEERVEHVLGPGLMLLKGILTSEQQQWLANYAVAAGNRPHDKGWYTSDGHLNVNASRGRIYDAVGNYPDATLIRKLVADLVRLARGAQPLIPDMMLTHMLLLLYTDESGMGWHRDSDENDGDNDHPIVSISLGNACEFGYKPFAQPERYVKLESGDVLIWGGPQRLLEHCVAKVHPGSCPTHLSEYMPNASSRINFTFRSAPNLVGKEEIFNSQRFWVDPS